MRTALYISVVISTICFHVPPNAVQASESLVPTDSLPRPGNLSDVLRCAGANEVLWTVAFRQDPKISDRHEAQRKAGWYAAVALQIFSVDTTAVTDAIESATAKRPRAPVLDFARQCRDAPENWRE